MPGKRAKILSAPDVSDLLLFASCTRHRLRNTVMALLSAKAGLRAGEIANLTRTSLPLSEHGDRSQSHHIMSSRLSAVAE
jgi:integrase